MRIARVLTRLNLGGPARQVLASDPILVDRGHEVRVFAGVPEEDEGDLTEELRARGVTVVPVPGLRRGLGAAFMGGDRRASRFLKAALAEFDPDIVHTHASKAGALGRRAALRAAPRAKRIHTFHGHVLEGYFSPPTSWVLRRVEARLAAQTHSLLAVSEATREDLVRLGIAPLEKLQVCTPGIELERFLELPTVRPTADLRRSLSIPRGAPVVAMIGRLAPVKRTRLGVEVFGALAAEFPDAWLLIAGDGAERRTVEAARRVLPESVQERVILLGARDDVLAVHEAMDVLLSTSFAEGMPVAMIEAAAAARPVVSTAVGGVPELVRSGVTGLLGTDVPALSAAVAGLLGDPDLRDDMGKRAREGVITEASAKALATRLEVHYRRLLTSSP